MQLHVLFRPREGRKSAVETIYKVAICPRAYVYFLKKRAYGDIDMAVLSLILPYVMQLYSRFLLHYCGGIPLLIIWNQCHFNRHFEGIIGGNFVVGIYT